MKSWEMLDLYLESFKQQCWVAMVIGQSSAIKVTGMYLDQWMSLHLSELFLPTTDHLNCEKVII